MITFTEKWIFRIGTAVCFVLSIVCIYAFDGTGDSGDSVQHYMFARYAPQHPELYFDHWAKPLFVLVASLFAKFGFIGMKWMNTLLVLLTVVCTHGIAQRLNLRNRQWIFLFFYAAPFFFVLIFSGLTEYLFGFLLSAAILLMLDRRILLSILVVSFLPFVRSEGLIFLGIFGFYLLVEKRWKYLPWLLTGHLVYGLAGFAVIHKFWWMVTENPYAKLSSTYGSGSLFHFFGQLFYVLAPPIYILLILGVLTLTVAFLRRRINLTLHLLILGGFGAFFVAHSLFWYLGIFNSMGLKRVFIAVMPLMAILGLEGFNRISERFQSRAGKLVPAIVLALIFLFPFFDNPASFHFNREFSLTPDQVAAKVLRKQIGPVRSRMCYAHPWLAVVFEIDPFDKNVSINLRNPGEPKPGDIVIWDSWFSSLESGVQRSNILADTNLLKLAEVHASDNSSEFLAFRVK